MDLVRNAEFDLTQSFVTALSETPHVDLIAVDRDVRQDRYVADAIIRANIGDRPILFVIEARRGGYPRDVREAAWQLRGYIDQVESGDAQVIPIVATESMSPGAKAFLKDEGIGYFDGGGSLYVPGQGVFVFIDRPPSKRAKRMITDIFAGRRGQAAHGVWRQGEAWFGVHDLARQALVSPATASETLIAMERHEWLEAKGDGPARKRRLADPRALLEAWSEHQASTPATKVRTYYASAPDVDWLSFRLDEACQETGARYEITGQVAGQVHARHLTQVTRLYCRIERLGGEPALQRLGARAVREGWNLAVIEDGAHEAFPFREEVLDGKPRRWIADPLQTYLDLLKEGGRSRDLAEHLRRERLDASW